MATPRAQETSTRLLSLFSMGPENENLSTFDNDNNHESRTVTHSWHPKLTLYRLLVLFATIGLGAAKAATSYLELNYASITLEWVAGVVVFIFLHLLGAYEEHVSSQMIWLFRNDCLQSVWKILAIFGMNQPQYRSDEFINSYAANPLITGYRILVTILVLFFGTLKSAFCYGNLQNDVTTVECVFGIGVVTILYCLGLYEDSSAKVYPVLFHVDFAPTLFHGVAVGIDATVVTGKLLLCIIGLGASIGVYMAFSELTKLTFNYRWHLAFFPEYPIVSLSTGVMVNALMGFMSFGGILFALGSIYLFFAIFFQLRMISSRRGIRRIFAFVQSVYSTYWDVSSPPRPRGQVFYLKRLLIRQAIKLPLKIYVTIVFLFVLFFLFWFALMCAYIPAVMLESYVPVTLTFPLVCFISVPISILMSSVFVRDFYSGFLNFLSDVRNDYMDQGPLLPSS